MPTGLLLSLRIPRELPCKPILIEVCSIWTPSIESEQIEEQLRFLDLISKKIGQTFRRKPSELRN